MSEEQKVSPDTKTQELKPLAPVQRRSARDFSHLKRELAVELFTDEGQRFAERLLRRALQNLHFLSYSFINIRDDEFAKPLCDEITKSLTEFEKTITEHTKKMREQLAKNQDGLTEVKETVYDNPITYKVDVGSFHGSKLITSLKALDNYLIVIREAAANGLVDPFAETDLRRQWNKLLQDITRRIREIQFAMRERAEELRKKREEENIRRAQKEAERLKREQEKRKQEPQEKVEAPTEEPAEEALVTEVTETPAVEDKPSTPAKKRRTTRKSVKKDEVKEEVATQEPVSEEKSEETPVSEEEMAAQAPQEA